MRFQVIKAKVLSEENVDSLEKRYKVKVLENYKVSTLCQLLTSYRPPFSHHTQHLYTKLLNIVITCQNNLNEIQNTERFKN